MSVLALCPSRGRPAAAHETLRSFQKTVADSGARLVFIVDRDDPLLSEYPAKHVHIVEPTGCMGDALRAATTPEVLAGATSVGMIGDDNRFRTPGWDRTLDGWLTDNIGIAYGDDGFQHERLPTSWWMSRQIVDAFGMTDAGLRHYYMDNWAKALGEAAKCLRYFPEVFIEHLHPLAGKAVDDAIYQRGLANEARDIAAFARWQRDIMPGDIARLRQIITPQRPRPTGRTQPFRVLADYHHPALYESLALLFEDRFGWELYRPVGLDWAEQGYWGFRNLDMKLDVKDFLSVDLFEDAYPRHQKVVTLGQARAMDWDYVLCSVFQNQTGFARFAAEQGAVFVQQLGNAEYGSSINWNLPARYLISSTLQAKGRASVTYHQEFDLQRFRYEPPGKSKQVANFSLRFNWQAESYALFTEAQRLAPKLKWKDFGTLYGALVRQDDVAAQMRASAFIWHDKKIGDGYGHAIHTAAAVGRPLVGHASYYRGRLAAPFWRDMETCIDLDRHSVADAVVLMQEILADPHRHRAMCEAMFETFRATVDFEEDARKVKHLLAGPIEADFYDGAYFTLGTKSSYHPYGPGAWAADLASMIRGYLRPGSVLDVGAAYGYVVEQLRQTGVDAMGFDISAYAVLQRVTEHVWQGSADDPAAFRPVDLIVGSEVAEHLTPEQATTFLTIARDFAPRLLLLICIDLDETADGQRSAVDPNDHSHINVRPMWWWRTLAIEAGWSVGDAGPFNEDARSKRMNWAGRFLLLERPSQ